MAFNEGFNSKIYVFRLLREQSIASLSFVEVMPPCPMLLGLIEDRSVRQCATASLLHVVHRATPPLRSRAAIETPPLHIGVLRAAARRLPYSRATSRSAILLVVSAITSSAAETARLARLLRDEWAVGTAVADWRGVTPFAGDARLVRCAAAECGEWSSRQSPTPDEAERRGSEVATIERELEGEGDGPTADGTGEAAQPVRPRPHRRTGERELEGKGVGPTADGTGEAVMPQPVRPRPHRRCRGGDWRARDGESGDWRARDNEMMATANLAIGWRRWQRAGEAEPQMVW
ncbi:hypothetical protein Syun_001810 [Stephania yunnanensis]|uniref:Uncharacterized protein n=1 Tax=Stephania yunnanensis TaxID=152371 RepID=A0AAP0LFF7_9MAGN